MMSQPFTQEQMEQHERLLDELIAEHHPNGVEHVELVDNCRICINRAVKIHAIAFMNRQPDSIVAKALKDVLVIRNYIEVSTALEAPQVMAASLSGGKQSL